MSRSRAPLNGGVLILGSLIFWWLLVSVPVEAAAAGSVPVVVRIRRPSRVARRPDDTAPTGQVLGRSEIAPAVWEDPPAASRTGESRGKETNLPLPESGRQAERTKTSLSPWPRGRLGLALIVLGSGGLVIWVLSQMRAKMKKEA